VIYSQIWLNLLPRDDHHFGYKQKNLHKKNTDPESQGGMRGKKNKEPPETDPMKLPGGKLTAGSN
jgi:hypothetical protein